MRPVLNCFQENIFVLPPVDPSSVTLTTIRDRSFCVIPRPFPNVSTNIRARFVNPSSFALSVQCSQMEKATGNRLSTPKRQVFRPPHSTYRFKNLLSLPRRLFCPPPSGSGEPSGDKKGSCCSGIATTPTVGLVRRLHRTPITEVRLQDVLDNKHLPPLTLKDFEDWLIWHQKSAENL